MPSFTAARWSFSAIASNDPAPRIERRASRPEMHFRKSRFELLGAADHFRVDCRPGCDAAKPDVFEKGL